MSAFLFHPKQSVETNDDGSVKVRFEAGGIDERCRRPFNRGESVTVEEPARLRERLAEMCLFLAAHHRMQHALHCVRYNRFAQKTRAIPQPVTKEDGESKMVRVKQEDRTGCGLACIAMLAGKRYATVRAKAMTIREDLGEGCFGKRRNFKLWSRDLKKLAKEFEFCLGRKARFRDPTPMSLDNFTSFMNDLKLGCDAVLAVNPQKIGEWHWVVWDCERGRVLDPKEPPCRLRIRPWYYLPVC